MSLSSCVVAQLERSAAELSLSLVEATVRTTPGSPARAQLEAQGVLCSLGPGRYVNRAVGLGVAEAGELDFDQIEAFFASCGVPAVVELASVAPDSLLEALVARGYRPDWFRNVYVVPPDSAGERLRWRGDSELEIREVDNDLFDVWLDLLAIAGGVVDPAARAVREEMARAKHAVPGSVDLLAFRRGEPVGCGSLETAAGVAWLGGAATLSEHRGRGVQTALINHRLSVATALGGELVAVTATPGAVSARNLERADFRLVYVQVMMARRGELEIAVR